ncbi:MAG: septal ring lytic transglycosylase RlpA family protein [Hydrogenophaga sp.]|uniref:septal ring lytic transglycosylase RlpA family protein n=1 Tax=Hydrogenophaga sp. TaxID=1904254 RepID=UPI0025C0052D|nr:septal ring lytic transglycosylase RlpA family protein [Hydrogenophaga sp.]MBT9553478.1 septal ring lytic transglycosylase RlpA family protein [Hydrogenophaga sp.]
MSIHPRSRTRCGRALTALLWVALLAGCAAPVPAPVGAVRGADGVDGSRPAVAPPTAPSASVPPVEPPARGDAAAELASPAVAPSAPDQLIAQGLASWYGRQFHGRRTASGERYDMHGFTAAHKTLPFGTRVRVRSLQTGKEVVVRINDRGPYRHRRIIDLSQAAITALGVRHRGVTLVELLRE